MRSLVFICMALVCCHSSTFASDSKSDAIAFMENFLKAEYNGDQSYRVDNSTYSPKRKRKNDEIYKPMIGEIFYWESEKLCVVDGYEIKDIELTPKSARVEVTFKEVGCSSNEGYGERKLKLKGKVEVFHYQLKYKNDRWYIYDPPIPMVSRKALIEYNDQIIEQMESFVHTQGTEIQKGFYNNLKGANKVLEDTR